MTQPTVRTSAGRAVLLALVLLVLLAHSPAFASGGACGSGSTTGCQQSSSLD